MAQCGTRTCFVVNLPKSILNLLQSFRHIEHLIGYGITFLPLCGKTTVALPESQSAPISFIVAMHKAENLALNLAVKL